MFRRSLSRQPPTCFNLSPTLSNLRLQHVFTMDSLATKVHILPTELFDEIYDNVFTASPDTIPITNSYRPPALLQVNRASRQDFAATYYGNGNILYLAMSTLGQNGS